MKGHAKVVSLMFSLHFIEFLIIKDFHSYKTYDIVRNLIDFQR